MSTATESDLPTLGAGATPRSSEITDRATPADRGGEGPDCERAVTAAALDLLDDPVVVLDAQGQVLLINRACGEAAACGATQVLGKRFWEVFAVPRERDAFCALVRTVVESGTTCQFEGHLRTGNGGTRAVSWSLREICDSQGVVQRVLTVGRLEDLRPGTDGGRTAADQGDVAPPGPQSPKRQIGLSPEDPGAASKPFRREEDGPTEERRRSPRRGYEYRQRIAPSYNGALPSSKDFLEVECQDISAGGFSFYMDEKPDFRDLVAALGKPPHVTHFTATVRRVQEVDRGGRKRFLVGCQFRGRLHL